MVRTQATEVLVVGAGPTGLFTALALAEKGVKVQIIDQQWRTAVHSYACALHANSLRLLGEFGLAAEAVKRGRKVEQIAFYEGATRHGEVKPAGAAAEDPCVLVLPQSELEEILERQLNGKHQVQVQWNHRLTRLQAEAERVVAQMDKLGETSTGYIVAHLERMVERTLQTPAAFVIGADGQDSAVRHALGIPYDANGQPELFEVFEFQAQNPVDSELRVVFHGDTTNALWPLPGNYCRWSFQKTPARAAEPERAKERLAVRFADEAQNPETLRHLRQRLQERAPWFKGEVSELEWAAEVQFARRLARTFGRERVWLLGDAAHQTGPVGMQSMNVGLAEAAEVAEGLRRILREGAGPELLSQAADQRQTQCERLLKMKGGWRARQQAPAWVKTRVDKIPPCLPATGQDLTRLAGQLGLEPC